MTIRLYDQDARLLHFTATVRTCQQKDEHYLVTLDQTAFFPEGGGQGADHGTLAGVHVLDAHDVDGEVLHLTDGPLTPGEQVEGQVDGARRLSMMQQHSGEHIFSGLVHKLYGYDNVEYTLQWQVSPDDVTWSDVEGATDARYSLTVTDENYDDFWRVQVFITDVTD